MPRAEQPRRRFELDRRWILRLLLVALAIALLVLIVKVAGIAFGDVRTRTVRGERAVEAPPPAPAPVAPR